MPEVAPAAVDAHQQVWDPGRADYPWMPGRADYPWMPALDRLSRTFDHAGWHRDAEPVVGVRHMVHREADPDWLLRPGSGWPHRAGRAVPPGASTAARGRHRSRSLEAWVSP